MNQGSPVGGSLPIFRIAMSGLGPTSHLTKDIHLKLVDVHPIADTQRLTDKLRDITQAEGFTVRFTQRWPSEDPLRVLGSFVMILMTIETGVIGLPGSMATATGCLVMRQKASRHGDGSI